MATHGISQQALNALVDIVRKQALEDAARVAEDNAVLVGDEEVTKRIAAAIRRLK